MLSGLAMAMAGYSRPCSGADHEILHAIDHLFPGTAGHGELAGVGALFSTYLRGADDLVASSTPASRGTGCRARRRTSG